MTNKRDLFPFFSIIIPVYNAEKYLEKCFNSIEIQSFHDYEVILIDDGSKDSSPKICDDYALRDKRVKVFHVENGGPSRARNIGFKTAIGKYIYCIDNDDYIQNSNYFRKIYEYLVNNSFDILQVGACYMLAKGNNEYILKKELSFDNDMKFYYTPASMILYLIENDKYETSCWTKFISRTFLLGNNLFFDETLTVEDLDWNMNFFEKVVNYGILNIKEYVHVYRKGSISAATGIRNIKNCQDQIKTIKRWKEHYEKINNYTELKEAALSYLCYQYFITLGRTTTIEKNAQNKLYNELKNLQDIIKYALGKRQILALKIYKIFGFNITYFLSGIYFKYMKTNS